jgi:uncharacterized protein
MDRVEVRVLNVVPGPQGQTLILGEEDGERYLPIVIGIPEALAIHYELTERHFDRPMTHDLLARVIEAAGATVRSVTIGELREGTFYATLNITQEGQERSIDSRSSDAIAIALRARAPIYVAEAVMRDAGRSFEEDGEEPARALLEDWEAEDDADGDELADGGTSAATGELLDRFREIIRDAGLDDDAAPNQV